MNDPYASFAKTPQTNAVMSTPSVSVTQPVMAAAPQPSATDRLEMLLKQLQEEQVSEPTPATTSPAQASSGASQDFVSALARVPAPAPKTQPDPDGPTPLSSLDGVIKTIGEQFEMGQPSLSELLQLAKKSAGTSASTATLTDSPMQFTRPQSSLSQSTITSASTAAPKITVMPPALEQVKPLVNPGLPSMNPTPVAPVAPNVAAAPETMNTAEVPSALAPTPAPATVPVAPAAEAVAPAPKRRVLTQYLQNLASHLQQHGQLNLPSYSKLVVAR